MEEAVVPEKGDVSFGEAYPKSVLSFSSPEALILKGVLSIKKEF